MGHYLVIRASTLVIPRRRKRLKWRGAWNLLLKGNEAEAIDPEAGVYPTAEPKNSAIIPFMNVLLLIMTLTALLFIGILGWQIYYAANPDKRRDSKRPK